MRFDIRIDNRVTPSDVREYAESRVGLAVHRAADRLSYVGVRLRPADASARTGGAAPVPVECQLEAWLRGAGVVAAKYADPDGFVAVDRAAAILEQAILRKLRPAYAARALGAEPYDPVTPDDPVTAAKVEKGGRPCIAHAHC